MGTVYCDNCGTSLLEETAKFCRACGKPTPLSEAPLSEAATKRFDERPSVQASTNPFAPSPTGPAYMAPFDAAGTLQTNDLRQKARKRNLIILVSMLAVMIFALAGLLAFLNFGIGSDGIQVPDPPPGVIGAPPPPPPPPDPPAPPIIDKTSSIDSSLIYPGSRQTMSVKGEGGKDVIQLDSDDSASKVADWYIARLNVTKKVSFAGQTVIKAGDINVVILGGEGGAHVIITRGGKD